MAPVDFETRLSSYQMVGIDTLVFIYHFEGNPRYVPLTTSLFRRIETGGMNAITSVLTLVELLTGPKKLGQDQLAATYERLLSVFPNLSLLPVDHTIARLAADLRTEYGLRTPDALHIATAMQSGAQAFITNDRSMRKVSHLEIVMLDDYVSGDIPSRS